MSALDDRQIHEIIEKVLAQVMGKTSDQVASDPAAAQTPEKKDIPAAFGTQGVQKKLIAVGSDHGGFEMKESIKIYLDELGFDVQDMGTHSKAAVDYPDYAHEVAKLVTAGKAWRGIMIDGAGIGSCIVANKVPGIRAGMAYDLSSAMNSREHNDTNILTLGAGLIGLNLAKQILKTWLTTEFGGERHQRRIEKISAVEKMYVK
jgi:ribose 5-phosphate isomerase B